MRLTTALSAGFFASTRSTAAVSSSPAVTRRDRTSSASSMPSYCSYSRMPYSLPRASRRVEAQRCRTDDDLVAEVHLGFVPDLVAVHRDRVAPSEIAQAEAVVAEKYLGVLLAMDRV